MLDFRHITLGNEAVGTIRHRYFKTLFCENVVLKRSCLLTLYEPLIYCHARLYQQKIVYNAYVKNLFYFDKNLSVCNL